MRKLNRTVSAILARFLVVHASMWVCRGLAGAFPIIAIIGARPAEWRVGQGLGARGQLPPDSLRPRLLDSLVYHVAGCVVCSGQIVMFTVCSMHSVECSGG